MPETATLAWPLFFVYLAVTFYLAYLGHKQTKSFKEFAIGKRDMGPGIAGVTLGACLASTVTFVINPGFVYAYGLPALIALTIPMFLGIFAGLAILGPGFRKHGETATTLPVWIGQRYGSSALRGWFAALSALNIFYVILIVVGAAYVMQATMGVSYQAAVAVVVCVVFSYVFFGGTYAHAYTNTAQGLVMLVVSVVIFGAAAYEIGSPAAAYEALAAQDANLVGLTHPESPFYRHWLEVLVAPFLIGFTLVAQPHLLIKSLYLKNTKDMAKFVTTGGACFVIFSLVLMAGLAARLSPAVGPGLNQDVAASAWIAQAFHPVVGALVSVAILAAAMSTLDGLLVAVSSIIGSDLVAHPAVCAKFGIEGEDAQGELALKAGRVTVIVLGAVAWIAALNPPALVGIFGTIGVYGLLVASLPAVLYGVLMKRPPSALGVGLASIVALAIHMSLYYGGVTINTGLTACAGLVVALPLPFFFRSRKAEAVAPARDESQRLIAA